MSRTITVPDWLNESFLQTVLQQDGCENTEVAVKSVEVTQAAPPGANYMSVLFRVRGCYQLKDDPDRVKEVSVIVKALIMNELLSMFLDGSGIVEKEYIAYKEFLPEIYNFLPKTERFTAKLLYSPEPKTLVLEDLSGQGFVMVDRLKQLDFEHCLVCLKTLAKFHAAGVAVIKTKPDFIRKLGKEPVFLREKTAMKEGFSKITKSAEILFTKAVKSWEGFEDFEEKSHRVWKTLENDLCDVFEPRKDSLNVLNHGDMWLNNIMVKYDSDGNIVDFRLVDFQQCRYTSPVTDLLYFLYSSANQEVRENRQDELFSAYLTTLNSTLEQLDCEDRLTKDQLDAELKRSRCFILVIMYSILSSALVDPNDLINMDELTVESLKSSENNPFEKCYYGKYYTIVAQQIMRYLYNVGFFEK